MVLGIFKVWTAASPAYEISAVIGINKLPHIFGSTPDPLVAHGLLEVMAKFSRTNKDEIE